MTTGDNPRKSFPIVGIGASAGGLNPLQRFLAELPADFGFALVFIQHLSAKHKSLLSELLSARRPSLAIQQISDGLKIQPGILYLAPPGREVRLRNSLFQTTVHPEGLIHLPIDEFFSSLAEDAGERSIAVIFSGAGTDGARGCQAIRSVGGTVYIQDPKTAEFDSMPLAAIATGQADAVLSPEDIAVELLKLQGIGQAVVNRELPITPEEFDGFFRLLREKTGSRFDHYKKSVVRRRIRRRMYLHGLSVVKDYLDLISADDHETALLASDLMIGVTSFFRDRVAWKALNLEAIRKIVAENTNRPIRVWTPASATGEEAYSIAMMLLHEIALAGKKRDIQVFATDLNERALERAREGKYPASITADVSQEYVLKYFTVTDADNFLVVNKDVRECVVFARQDLLTDPPFSRLDLIICRNFLIYLEPEAQEKSITLFHYALKEGGYLFLGNAETVGRKSAAFKSVGHKQCRVYRKLETKPASRLPISVPHALERQAPPARHAQITEPGRSAMEIIQEKLLEAYGPASVAIDQHYQIIYHNGPTNRYLHQPRGVPTQNLLELVPENLQSRIRGAIYRSGREERPVLIRTSVAGDDNKSRHVTLRITKAAENLHIIVFQEKSPRSKKEAVEQDDAAVIEETAIHQLESELSATKVDLQSHIEQLKSMNEEFQSSNEELQAANEELETSREELQSLNEELVTVNSQLQGKIEEQDATNDDLNNFQASTNIPMIFLDTHFRVKRFTPAMLRFIKLLPSDIGRPIVDMSQENLGPDLTSDAQSVLEGLVPARKELEISGAWYVRTTLPYRTADNRIEGVVITYNDVSELKKSEERTKHLASFPELNPNPVCEVHTSGKVNFCNPATEKVLTGIGMDSEDLTVFLPEDIDDILRDMGNNEEASLYREKVIRDRVFGMTVHLVPQFDVARIYAYDITERKRAEEELHQSEERFRLLVERVKDYAIFMLDPEGRVTTWNEGAERLKGYKAEEIIGQHFSRFYPAEDAASGKPRRELDAATAEGWFEDEGWRVRKDGSPFWASVLITALRDGTGTLLGFTKVTRDITERKRAEVALLRLNKALKALSDSSQAIIRATDKQAYLNDVCRIIVEDCGYSMAWIGFAENDENKSVRPAAYAGFEDGYLETLKLTWNDTERGRGPTGTAIRTGKVVVCRNMLTDPAFAPWREQALKRGYASSIVFPITTEGSTLGAITIYSTEADPFSNGEIKLLTELADNLAHGIEFLRVRAAREQSEEALRESESRFRLALKNSPVSVAIQDNNLVYQWAYNQRTRRPDEVVGNTDADLFAPEDLPPILEAKRRVLESGIEEHTGMWLIRNGRRMFFDLYYEPMRDASGNITGVGIATVNLTDQKLAEEALRESEEQFRALADSIPNLAWWANGDGYITWYNRRWYEYTGTTLEQMEGWGWQSVHDPEALPKVLEQWKASIATGEPFEMEFPLRGHDGIFRAFLTRGMPVKDSAGRVVRWFGTNTDVSSLKEAEDERERLLAEVQRHVAELDAVFKVLPYLVSVHDRDGKYLRVNQAVIDLFGFDPTTTTREEIARRLKAHFPDGRPLTSENMPSSKALNGETVKDVEYVIANERGEEHALLFNASPLKLGDRIYGAVFSQLDITERKRAETEIQALAQQRQIALDAAHLGWWQYNPVTRVAEWDDGYKAIFGVSGYTRPNDEILAQIIHPDDLPGLWAKVEAALNPVDPQPYRAEYRINRPDGALRWIEAHGSVTFEGEGEDRRAVNLVGTVADITERKKAETDILQLSEDLAIRNMTLESVNKELESFIYSVSHDLRAPIRTMSGFAKIINEDYAGKLDAQGQDYLNRILKGSERSTQLIDDLLHLSKISRQELDRIEIDLSKKASKVAEELREMDPGRSVEVVIQEGMTASVDPRLIELALSNLIGNAWKFTSKKEKALIEFGAVNSLLRIADLGLRNEMMTEQVKKGKTVYFIRDNGDGFNMKYADKMFWPFHRLHADKEFEGTGIGLTIVERIIHRHGGKVWAESEVGKGAVFYFTL